ncbi:MAG UNVERIFIED_CONTAM: hypothetical protein LVR18_42535 [Planctomycetaceae bacterium]|jgi:hypothetical protein
MAVTLGTAGTPTGTVAPANCGGGAPLWIWQTAHKHPPLVCLRDMVGIMIRTAMATVEMIGVMEEVVRLICVFQLPRYQTLIFGWEYPQEVIVILVLDSAAVDVHWCRLLSIGERNFRVSNFFPLLINSPYR